MMHRMPLLTRSAIQTNFTRVAWNANTAAERQVEKEKLQREEEERQAEKEVTTANTPSLAYQVVCKCLPVVYVQ